MPKLVDVDARLIAAHIAREKAQSEENLANWDDSSATEAEKAIILQTEAELMAEISRISTIAALHERIVEMFDRDTLDALDWISHLYDEVLADIGVIERK